MSEQSKATGSIEDADVQSRVEALVSLAGDADPRARKSVAIALGKLGRPAVGALCDLLGDPDEGVRLLACQALGRACDPACLPALLACTHDESAPVRAGVLFCLASLASHGDLSPEQRAALFTPMVVMAFDPDDGVRADAAATLGTLADERATQPLLVLIEDDVARVRANACESLGAACGSDLGEVAEALVGRLCDKGEPPLVRASALDALAHLAQRDLVGITSLLAQASACACDLLLSNVTPSKDDGLVQDEVGERTVDFSDLLAMATWALGFLPAPERGPAHVVAALECSLESGDEWRQRYAVEALARQEQASGSAALERAWGRQSAGELSLCPAAVQMLGAVREGESVLPGA